jgi:hypothetical protein
MDDVSGSPAVARARSSPLIVGVSGHRDLHPDCIAAATESVEEFLDRLRALAPDTQIRIVVGMAEGADLLVARLALARNLIVEAVLPMPLAQYASDFEPESLEQLQQMLQHPNVHCIELPLPAGGDTLAPAGGRARDALYSNLSEFLMRRSSLLLALWDGVPSPLVGGTADTVLRYLAARTQEAGTEAVEFVREPADSVSETQFVHWIGVFRRGATDGNRFLRPCYLSSIGENLLQRHEQMPPELQHQVSELNHYNVAFERLASHEGTPPQTLLANLPADIPGEERQALEQIDVEYGRADALAVHYQRRSDRLFHFSSYTAALIGLLFLTYAELLDSSLLLAGYLLVLLSSIGVFYLYSGRHWFSRHLVCRVLAETMRTKFFLRLAGVDHLVNANELINLTGINQFSGFTWINNVLRSVDDPECLGQRQPCSEQQLDYVHQAWIVDQDSYFRSKVARLERTYRRLERMKTLLIVVMVLVALVLVAFSHPLELASEAIGVGLHHWLVFLMGLLPVWLGIWELYQYKMATRELLWQYRNQLSHFSRARLQLSRATTWTRRMEVLAELGKESLMESYLWMIHRYHREHEPPAAG